jgi:hypothetical protein
MLARFWWGLGRPFALLRLVFAQPVARRAWLVTVGLQAAVTLSVGSVMFVRDLAEGSNAAETATGRVALGGTDGGAATADAGVATEETVDPEPDDPPEADTRPEWIKRLALWASSLVVVQTLVLALTRDFQDRLARDLALVAGLQPEDVPLRPRVRVDLKWLWRKGRRRLRGMLTVAQGVIALAPLLLIGAALGYEEVGSAVVSLVSAYWWLVFTAARSARAWVGEEDPTPATPVRTTTAIYGKIPGLKWFARASVWTTRSMAAPSRAIERDFAGFAGLGLARLVATVPVLRLGLRAAIIVAAGELLESTGPEVRLVTDRAPPEPPSTNGALDPAHTRHDAPSEGLDPRTGLDTPRGEPGTPGAGLDTPPSPFDTPRTGLDAPRAGPETSSETSRAARQTAALPTEKAQRPGGDDPSQA